MQDIKAARVRVTGDDIFPDFEFSQMAGERMYNETGDETDTQTDPADPNTIDKIFGYLNTAADTVGNIKTKVFGSATITTGNGTGGSTKQNVNPNQPAPKPAGMSPMTIGIMAAVGIGLIVGGIFLLKSPAKA